MRCCNRSKKLSEERVGPGKPGAREVLRIVFEVALVHKAEALRGAFEHVERAPDLVGVAAGEYVDDLRHGPDHVAAYVRAADAFSCGALEEPGIARAPAEGARAVVERRIGGSIEVGKAEQAGDVGVVHQELAAIAVDLVGPDGAFGSCGNGVLVQCLFDLFG